MNAFDSSILTFFNHFAHRWQPLDSAVVWATHGLGVKGTFTALFVVWPWAAASAARTRTREIICSTVLACVVAIAIGLVIQRLVPWRTRPLENPELGLVAPYGQDGLHGWPHAFPSDHAILFTTLATGCFLIRPALGLVAYAYGTLLIGLPRIYCGLHHPTDLLAGAAIGIAVAAAFGAPALRARLCAWPMRLASRHEGVATALLFAFAVQVTTTFVDVQALIDLARGSR